MILYLRHSLLFCSAHYVDGYLEVIFITVNCLIYSDQLRLPSGGVAKTPAVEIIKANVRKMYGQTSEQRRLTTLPRRDANLTTPNKEDQQVSKIVIMT